MIEDNIVQDTPILTDKEIEPLKQIKITVTRGKAPSTYSTNQDLYTATDHEFMAWLAKVTKTKKDKLMEGLDTEGKEEGGGWNNANRLNRRLTFLKRFRKSIDSYIQTVDKK